MGLIIVIIMICGMDTYAMVDIRTSGNNNIEKKLQQSISTTSLLGFS